MSTPKRPTLRWDGDAAGGVWLVTDPIWGYGCGATVRVALEMWRESVTWFVEDCAAEMARVRVSGLAPQQQYERYAAVLRQDTRWRRRLARIEAAGVVPPAAKKTKPAPNSG